MLCLLLAAGVISGCSSDDPRVFSPEAPGVDDPPFDRQVFDETIVPLMARQGCATAACHGSSQNPFPLTGSYAIHGRGWILATADHVAGEFPAPMDQNNTPNSWWAGNTG